MLEILPGVLWFNKTDDVSFDALRGMHVSVLVTDRTTLRFSAVLSCSVAGSSDREGLKKLCENILRLYKMHVGVGILIDSLVAPDQLISLIIASLIPITEPQEIKDLMRANYNIVDLF